MSSIAILDPVAVYFTRRKESNIVSCCGTSYVVVVALGWILFERFARQDPISLRTYVGTLLYLRSHVCMNVLYIA